MAYFPPGWDPDLNTDDYESDLEIINNAILQVPIRLAEAERVRDIHKTFWDYWNPMCVRFETYVKNINGKDMMQASLSDADVEAMAATINNDIIFPIDSGYYGPEPMDDYMYGPHYAGVTLGTTFVNEWSEIVTEETFQNNDPGSAAGRDAAQALQVISLTNQLAALNGNIDDVNDGLVKYPWLGDLRAELIAARDECVVAKASVDNEVAAGGPWPYNDTGRVAYLVTRRAGCNSRPASMENEMALTYAERYTMTNARANIGSGSIQPPDNIPLRLDGMEKEKARLESIIASYEDF